jgi:ligand-binding sensor domain-containing protein
MKRIIFSILTAGFLFGCSKDEPTPEPPVKLPDNHVNAIFINSDGTRYFATRKGIASFDGTNWLVFHDNPKVATGIINDLGYEQTDYGPELWLGTNHGVNVVSLPVDGVSGATTYTTDNSKTLFPDGPGLAGDSVFVVKLDGNNIRWFGTNEGISAFQQNVWPALNFGRHYSSGFFRTNRVTSFDYSNDTIYIGTKGGGVARMVGSSVDAITAASPYEIPWSMLPSDNVLSVFTDGSVQWYGTDEGIAKHTGTAAKLNWESFYEQDGLINNVVQCINKDLSGLMWFGTPEGVSSFDGINWTSYTQADGIAGNNVLSIAIDKDGSVWFGTDSGVSHFSNNAWTNYYSD